MSFSRCWKSGDWTRIVPAAARRAVDLLAGQRERRGQVVEIGELRLVLEHRERHVDRVQPRGRRGHDAGQRGVLADVNRARLADAAHDVPARDHVAQELDRLVRIAVDRHPGRLEQDLEVARRPLVLVPVGPGHRQRVDDHDDDALDAVERRLVSAQPRGLELLQDLEHRAHAEVVAEAAVDEVDVGPRLAVVELHDLRHALDGARRGSRRILGIGHREHPRGKLEPARAAVVVDGDRRQHQRHRRRSRGRAREPHRREVGAQHVEHRLREPDPRARRDVRRHHGDVGAGPAREVREGGAVEQDLVVQIRRHLGASPCIGGQGRPVERVERAREEGALDVALQETLLVIAEELVAVQAVGERGEAAARHAGDDVDGVDEANGVALGPDRLGPAQHLEHAVGERRRSRAAPREGEDHQRVALVARRPFRELVDEPIAVGLVEPGERRVHRTRRASGQDEREEAARERSNGCIHGDTAPSSRHSW
jgi:hypothetical protein